jgi:hypothetical protein
VPPDPHGCLVGLVSGIVSFLTGVLLTRSRAHRFVAAAINHQASPRLAKLTSQQHLRMACLTFALDTPLPLLSTVPALSLKPGGSKPPAASSRHISRRRRGVRRIADSARSATALDRPCAARRTSGSGSCSRRRWSLCVVPGDLAAVFLAALWWVRARPSSPGQGRCLGAEVPRWAR